MAGSAANAIETDSLKYWLTALSLTTTRPTAWYIALFTACSSDGSSVTEVTGGSYARQAVTWNTPASGATDNNGALTFPTATANWGTVTHFGVYDASTSGNLLYWGDLTNSQIVNTGNIFQVASGDLDITCD